MTLLRTAGVRLVVSPADAGVDLTIDSKGSQGLRIAYDVVRTATPTPNTGQVTILNLSERTRRRLEGAIPSGQLVLAPPGGAFESVGSGSETLVATKYATDATIVDLPEVLARRYQYAYVRLKAGYDGVLSTVSEGTSSKTRSRKPDLDWTTTIDLGDSSAALAHAAVARTFDAGSPVFPAVRHLVRVMGLLSGNVDRPTWDKLDIFGSAVYAGEQYFGTAFTTNGDPADLLSQLLGSYGIRWFVDQGQAWLLSRDGYLPGPVVELGVPREEPEILDTGIRVRVNHNPVVRPGGRARVTSRVSKDTWFVEAVRFAGDTHGELLCEVELTPIQRVLG